MALPALQPISMAPYQSGVLSSVPVSSNTGGELYPRGIDDWMQEYGLGFGSLTAQNSAYQQYLDNFGASTYKGQGTPLTAEQKATLSAQLDRLGGAQPLSAQEKEQILSLPIEMWSNPETAKFLGGVITGMTNTPYDPIQTDGGNPRDSFKNLLNQMLGGSFGVPGGHPVTDLFVPQSNIGGANAGLAALSLGGAGLIGAGVGAGAGLGDVAAVPGGAVGGGGASGVGFGTTIGGDAITAAPYYTGADAAAIGQGINPETGLPMDLGQEQLGLPGSDVGASSGAGALAPVAGTGGVAAAPIAGPGVGAGAAAGGAGAGNAFSRTLSGDGSTADLLSTIGTIGSTGLGVFGSLEQQKAATDLSNKLFETGAPSRARFEASMTPGFDPRSIPGYSGAVDNASEALLRRLSATGGNPFGNPGGLIEANKQVIAGTALPAIQDYQGRNAAAGGFSSFGANAPGAASQAIGAQGNVYNAVGSGLASLTNPQPTLQDTLRMLGLGRAGMSAA